MLNSGKFIQALASDMPLELKTLAEANWEDEQVSTTNIVINLFNK